MDKVQKHNIFKAQEVGWGRGWIVDLSPANYVTEDCYWRFNTKPKAQKFAELVNAGESAERASCVVNE